MKGAMALVPVLLVFSAVFISGCTTAEINSFEDCIAAGYPALESHPRQCNTPDGKHFVEVLDEPLIGGDRDENGCLGPAGYTWDEEVGACIRSWELGEDDKFVAGLAVDFVGWEYATTVIEVEPARCGGCYFVDIEKGEQRDMTRVSINNWTASGKVVTRHTCTEEEKAAEICTMEYVPVCGWDNLGVSKTYGNACGACSAGSEYWEAGECVAE